MGARRDEAESGAPLGGLPLSTAPELRALFARLMDREHMLAVFRRELCASSDSAVRLTSCNARARYHRDFVREGRLQVVYTVGLETRGAAERELVLLGVAPVGPEFLDERIQELARALRGHPAVAPFERCALHVAELRLALLLFPLDPALPVLAEITGTRGDGAMAACGGRAGSGVRVVHCEVRHYDPFDRAVVRVLANPALDAATFLARLRREPLRRRGRAPELERMAGTFRRRFLAQQPESAPDLALYEGLVLVEQMLRSFRRAGDSAETAERIRCLAAGAEELLDQVAKGACSG